MTLKASINLLVGCHGVAQEQELLVERPGNRRLFVVVVAISFGGVVGAVGAHAAFFFSFLGCDVVAAKLIPQELPPLL